VVNNNNGFSALSLQSILDQLFFEMCKKGMHEIEIDEKAKGMNKVGAANNITKL
jgi:hypothetical protein